eukprot:759832-Hanusia_phi.AAC.6
MSESLPSSRMSADRVAGKDVHCYEALPREHVVEDEKRRSEFICRLTCKELSTTCRPNPSIQSYLA